MSKYVVEYISTFFLVLTILCTVNSDSGSELAPIAIGAILTGLIYAGYQISGAHFNPAVTIAVWIRGKCAGSEIAPYIISQLLGAGTAAAVGSFLFDLKGTGGVEMNIAQGMMAEFLGTFALVWVILFVATTESISKNSYYGLSIGLVVTGSAYAFGGFGTFGCFNPAVALGFFLGGFITPISLLFILVSNLIAGALAAWTFKSIYSPKGE